MLGFCSTTLMCIQLNSQSELFNLCCLFASCSCVYVQDLYLVSGVGTVAARAVLAATLFQ